LRSGLDQGTTRKLEDFIYKVDVGREDEEDGYENRGKKSENHVQGTINSLLRVDRPLMLAPFFPQDRSL